MATKRKPTNQCVVLKEHSYQAHNQTVCVRVVQEGTNLFWHITVGGKVVVCEVID